MIYGNMGHNKIFIHFKNQLSELINKIMPKKKY